MEEKIYNLLTYISSESKGKYTLFNKSELMKKYGDGTVTEDEFTSLADSLAATGYIDVKYSDKEVILMRSLGKSLTAMPDVKPETVEAAEVKDGDAFHNFLRFFISFLGGFSGALVGIAVFAAMS